MAQIKSFGVVQTAKFAAVVYFIVFVIFMIPFRLITMTTTSTTRIERGMLEIVLGILYILLSPVFYAIMGFVFVAIGCQVYNIIAKHIGGIEIEIE